TAAARLSFKRPTLRSLGLTYPCFHDSAAQTLAAPVGFLGRIPPGRRYTHAENAKTAARLEALTRARPTLSPPILPPTSDLWPRPWTSWGASSSGVTTRRKRTTRSSPS